MTTTNKQIGNGYTVKVESWSGNRRPYRAKVYSPEGKYVGTTGGCSSPSSAIESARRIALKDLTTASGLTYTDNYDED
jgi:hypothetical protein